MANDTDQLDVNKLRSYYFKEALGRLLVDQLTTMPFDQWPEEARIIAGKLKSRFPNYAMCFELTNDLTIPAILSA